MVKKHRKYRWKDRDFLFAHKKFSEDLMISLYKQNFSDAIKLNSILGLKDAINSSTIYERGISRTAS